MVETGQGQLVRTAPAARGRRPLVRRRRCARRGRGLAPPPARWDRSRRRRHRDRSPLATVAVRGAGVGNGRHGCWPATGGAPAPPAGNVPPWCRRRRGPATIEAYGTSGDRLGAPVNGEVVQLGWYRFRRTFGRRWGEYLTLVLLVGLVGGLAMGSVAAARRTDSSFSVYWASTNPSDLVGGTGVLDPKRRAEGLRSADRRARSPIFLMWRGWRANRGSTSCPCSPTGHPSKTSPSSRPVPATATAAWTASTSTRTRWPCSPVIWPTPTTRTSSC